MIATLLGAIAASPWTRAALRYGAIALAVLLFLLALRHVGSTCRRLIPHQPASTMAPGKVHACLAADCLVKRIRPWYGFCMALPGCRFIQLENYADAA